MANCYACGGQLPDGKIHFKDSCEKCMRDSHICKNCEFYDEKYNNFCREPSAERVIDKEKNNYCDYFIVSGRAGGENKTTKEELKSAADALFKKS